MISQTVEYALRAVAYLANDPDRPHTAQQVSEGTQVPTGYAPKVLQAMVRAGLLHAQRGLHGGFSLAWPPDQITMLDVVNAIDPLKRIEHCPLGLPSHVKLCPLHRKLDDALGLIEKAFAGTTIASLLVEKKGESKPLCDVTISGRKRPRKQKA